MPKIIVRILQPLEPGLWSKDKRVGVVELE